MADLIGTRARKRRTRVGSIAVPSVPWHTEDRTVVRPAGWTAATFQCPGCRAAVGAQHATGCEVRP